MCLCVSCKPEVQDPSKTRWKIYKVAAHARLRRQGLREHGGIGRGGRVKSGGAEPTGDRPSSKTCTRVGKKSNKLLMYHSAGICSAVVARHESDLLIGAIGPEHL